MNGIHSPKRAMLKGIALFLLVAGYAMADESLKVGDVGAHQLLATKHNPEGLTLVYVPALAALLSRAEQLKRAKLTAAEADRIANDAEVIAMPPAVAEGVIRNRGGLR